MPSEFGIYPDPIRRHRLISWIIVQRSLNLQLLLPFLHRVPRPWMAVLTTVIIIPIAAARAHSIYTDLINFLSIIGKLTLSEFVEEHG